MLDNKAKISDIIASLQESEGINQKAELKSILVDKGITVEDTNDMASIVSKINGLVKLSDTCIPENIRKDVNINGIIGTLDLESLGGKKWASGSVQVNSSSMTIQASLSFKPSVIYSFKQVYAGTNYGMEGFLETVYIDLSSIGAKQTVLSADSLQQGNTSAIYHYYNIDGSNYYVTTAGFKLPVTGSGTTNWIAIE